MGDLQGSGIAVEIAKRKSHLQSLLKQQFSGLVVTMIHKFDKADANLSTRDNVFVLIDEAHRSTGGDLRSEEHTSELQSLMRISYAVFCLKKNKSHLYNLKYAIQHY